VLLLILEFVEERPVFFGRTSPEALVMVREALLDV
jgi:hypothetical protein